MRLLKEWEYYQWKYSEVIEFIENEMHKNIANCS